MKNVLITQGFHAVIEYDPTENLLQGRFADTSKPVSFSAKDVDALKAEAEVKLEQFLKRCKTGNTNPRKTFSGKFNLRVSPDLHAALVTTATLDGQSLNEFVTHILSQEIEKRG